MVSFGQLHVSSHDSSQTHFSEVMSQIVPDGQVQFSLLAHDPILEQIPIVSLVVDDLVGGLLGLGLTGGLGVSFPINTKYTRRTRSPTNPPAIRIFCFPVKFIYIKTIFYLEYCF
jgi:hypothetical protein